MLLGDGQALEDHLLSLLVLRTPGKRLYCRRSVRVTTIILPFCWFFGLQLAYHQTLPTHTSLQVNSAVVSSASGQREHLVVDVPGHPRIRDQFKEYIPDAKAVVFVVDASTISRNGPLVAECVNGLIISLYISTDFSSGICMRFSMLWSRSLQRAPSHLSQYWLINQIYSTQRLLLP